MPNSLFRNGSVSSRGSGWFRLALLAVQVGIIGGAPLGDFLSSIYGWDYQWTPARQQIWYVSVLAAMIGLGMLRLPEILEGIRAWRGIPEPREEQHDEA